jgi:hypothetical protein
MTLIKRQFNNQEISFEADTNGMVNLTQMADATGTRLDNYLRLDKTKSYIETLSKSLTSEVFESGRGNGGGTWGHKLLAIHFAQWISDEFHIWCNQNILGILEPESKPNIHEALDITPKAIEAAKAFGLVDEQMKFAANRLILRETKVNMLERLGIELVIESAKTTFTPTQMAERMGLKSAREVNIILQNLGYQKNVGGDARWEPTEKGKPFSKLKGVDLEAKKSVKVQLVWYETIFEQLDIKVLSKLN